MDWPTLFVLRLIMILGGIIRGHPLIFIILIKLRFMHFVGWIHNKLMVRLPLLMDVTVFKFAILNSTVEASQQVEADRL